MSWASQSGIGPGLSPKEFRIMARTDPPPQRPASSPRRWLPTVVIVVGATAAGVQAAHSPAWAVGLGTATGVFAAANALRRCDDRHVDKP